MDRKEVLPIDTVELRFQKVARENGIENPEAYLTQNLKLTSTWGEISFVTHPGLPDMICSKELTLGDVVRKAEVFGQNLQAHGKSSKDADDQPIEDNDDALWDEERIVHLAIGILKNRMRNTKKPDKEYYSSTEMSLDASKELVDPLLYKAIAWLGNKMLYSNATTVASDGDPKYLSITCDITTLNTKVISPKHLGLSVHLYHEYGSRKLIEDMHVLGYGISYTELRHFLTSAAIHVAMQSKLTPSGALVPQEVKSTEEGGTLILAAGDNWDHNERTPDGKHTTHAMTSILVTQTQPETSFSKIPRSLSRTCDVKTSR